MLTKNIEFVFNTKERGQDRCIILVVYLFHLILFWIENHLPVGFRFIVRCSV